MGKLSDVMKSVMDIEKEQDVKLNALVTVVNALKASKQMKAFGEFFNNQIEHATTVVLSRSQKATEAQLELCVKQIQELNPKAAVITTPWEEISGEQILKVIEGQDTMEAELLAEAHHREEEEHHHSHDHDHEHHHDHDHDHEHHHDHDHNHEHHHDHEHDENCTCGCHDHDHHHHHADEIFTSWGKETPHKYTREHLEGILKAFDMVPGEYEIRDGEPDYTGRLCVIGTDIDEHQLEELFGIA